MEFSQFKKLLQKQFKIMSKTSTTLFETDVDSEELWNLYLDSFPPGTNEIYREKREFDCSCCRHFIKNFGNVVMIGDDRKLISIWDFEPNDPTYTPVVQALRDYVKSKPVVEVFVTKDSYIGTNRNYEKKEDGTVRAWDHFYVDLPKVIIFRSSKSIESIMGHYRDSKNVFKRSLEEISMESIETVLDLISQNSLYKGSEWKAQLETLLRCKKSYNKTHFKDNFCWSMSVELGPGLSKIKNHSIGVLLTDISEGMDLDKAVRRYEAIVAPSNYKRPKAIFTQKMVDQAKETLQSMGLLGSLERRFATLEDISINNILFANRDAASKMQNSDIFNDLKPTNKTKPNFTKIETIPVDDFVKDVLPRTTTLQVYLENRHKENLVSLIAPKDANAPSLFKWGNPFSWSYNGNITDSMKERVKAAGGKVDGVLRFSIQWNESGDNQNDFDAHCIEPGGTRIYFSNKGRIHPSSGRLDVDIIHPDKEIAVENITWTDLNKMREGKYKFLVHVYSYRHGRDGFRAEIEYNGQIYSYDYPNDVKWDQKIEVAQIEFSKTKGITFLSSMETKGVSSQNLWGLDSNKFHPVTTVMYSPNYWDEQKGIGNQHYFFMLDKCINDTTPNGFYNEFLKQELDEHKRVFEALGSKCKVEDSELQLSGLGFSTTKRNDLVVKVEGSVSRMLKIIF